MATTKLTVPIVIGWKEIEAYMAQHDIVEVVRCKDCKHRPYEDEGGNIWEPDGGDFTCPLLFDDPYYNGMPEDDFFCKYGERKEDGSD